MKLRPPDFEPPYPAFTCELFKLQPGLTVGQIGVQYPDGEATAPVTALAAAIEASMGGDSAPWRRERCTHVDPQGYRNDIVIAYWRRHADFLAWRARTDVAAWADGPQAVGLWFEALSCPVPQMETSYSNADPDWGLADQCPVHLDPNHGYFGSMRDRIPAAEDRGLPGALRSLPAGEMVQQTIGRQLRAELPDNACFIRTVQGWQDCDAQQRADFLATMMPVYRAGVAYLRDHPHDTNCVAARLVDMLDPDAQIQTQTLAWFLGLEDLERWAHEHPTHHAILTGMSEFASRYDLDMQIVLGHEVYVVPADHGYLEYSNCHPQTGFLRFFPGREV